MGLVVHVPHATLFIPSHCRAQFGVSDEQLAAEAQASADLHTDMLARQAWPGATIIEASVSRVVLDVERYPDDAAEEMATRGRGMIYMRAHDGSDLFRSVSKRQRADLKAAHYDPHWTRLRAASAGNVLIDLHSYPAEAWPIEPDQSAHRPEIDIGTTPGLSPRSWVDNLRGHFETHGFEVGENTPYAGVVDAGASAAVMIEIRRDILSSPADRPRWLHIVTALSGLPTA